MGQNDLFCLQFLAIWEVMRGGGSDWTYFAIQLSFHPYLCTCEISKQSDKNFLSSNPKHKLFFHHIWGSWLPNFQDSMTSSQSRHMYTMGTNNYRLFIYVPQCESIFGYSEGGWVAPLSDWAQLVSQLSSHLYKYTYKIWKPSVQDFISYRVHKEISVDPDAAAHVTMIKP